MTFQKDFDGLLNEILTNYKETFPEENITEGSAMFVNAANMASMLWGLYHGVKKALDQAFVESADREYKEKHAAEFGIATNGKSDGQIVDEVLEAKRNKRAGGNLYDYVAWAKQVALADEQITNAVVVKLARGEGTFDIIVVGSKNDGKASPEICKAVYDHIDRLRPVGSGFSDGMKICCAVPQAVKIEARGDGLNWNKAAAEASIKSYVNNLMPREPLRIDFIRAIMYQYGAETTDIIFPASDIVPPETPHLGAYGMFRAGQIDVS